MKALLCAALFTATSLAAFAQTNGLFNSIDENFKFDVIHPPHGLNLGNYLEAPDEGKWSGGRKLQESDFKLIHDAGFTVIRVPISWAAHCGPAPDYKIDPAFLARVDWIVEQAQKNILMASLDYHNDTALMHDPATQDDRFVALWKQIAEHFQSAPTAIAFELLNEPYDKLSGDTWNALLARTLKVVRETNPTRTIVVGPGHWNSIGALDKLVLPESDQNLIVTFHYYDPMKFTHQGASWIDGSTPWLGTKWQGTPDEEKALNDSFDKAAAWGKAHHRPMYLGEFGAFSKGDMDSRARWTSAVVQSATSRGISWTYWEFSSGFGAYDPDAKKWRPELLSALLRPAL